MKFVTSGRYCGIGSFTIFCNLTDRFTGANIRADFLPLLGIFSTRHNYTTVTDNLSLLRGVMRKSFIWVLNPRLYEKI